MKSIVGIIVLLSLLAAGLQSAANACTLAQETENEVQQDLDSSDPADDCSDCTGTCFCNCHSGLVTATLLYVATATPQALVANLANSFASRASPPVPPPPITT